MPGTEIPLAALRYGIPRWCDMCGHHLRHVVGSAAEAQPPSSLLEDALRQELQLKDGEFISTEQLGEVEQLLVCGQELVGTIREHEELVN